MFALENFQEQQEEIREYIDKLHSKDPDGYIQILQIFAKDKVKAINKKYDEIFDNFNDFESLDNLYLSANTFYYPKRFVDNLRHLRALYIDIDAEKKGISKNDAVYGLYEKVNSGAIPEPTLINDSGRGIHVYWIIEHAPKGALFSWQQLEDYFFKQLEHLGADPRATDAARVLRIPGTINTKNGQVCKTLIINDNTYSMYDLREKYLNYTKPAEPKPSIQKKHKQQAKIIRNFNSYSLHSIRAKDIEKLCELRNYDVKGHRNFILHCYAYWKGIYTREPQDLENIVNELNDKFKEPQKQTEVRAILRCVPKAIKKFIDYEVGIATGEIKRVSKGMHDKGGYWYKNETLIDNLNITPQEQRHLETIISKEEKYRRWNKKRNAARRNENGLTPKQQELQELKEQIQELRAAGFTIREIAKELNISKTKADRLLK